MNCIDVHRQIHIEQPTELEEAYVTSLGYCSHRHNTLVECVWFGTQRNCYFTSQGLADSGYAPPVPVIRRSTDNGRSWQVDEEWPLSTSIYGRRELFHYSPNWIPSPDSNALLRIHTTNETIRGTHPWEKQNPSSITRLLWTAISQDAGESWSEPEQLIVQGDDYDHGHWAPGIHYGRNGGGIEGVTPIWTSDGRFVLPMFINTSSDLQARGIHWHNALLIGQWDKGNSDVLWEVSRPVHVDPERGHDEGEPSVAILPDGRFLMTLRSRSFPDDGLAIRSAKFWTVTDDLGKTWSDPDVLTYTDGSQVYCPASLAHVVRSSKNGRLYIIGNFLDEPTEKGCDPRSTLQIAEVDPDAIQVRRETMTVIETRNKQAGQPGTIRFSNWRRYEDRKTGNIVIVMTACPGDIGRFSGGGCPPHSYRYDIALPDS